MKENVFWVVRAVEPYMNSRYIMFHSVPRIVSWNGGRAWTAAHGHHSLSDGTAKKFEDLEAYGAPVKVRLVKSDRENPDFYMQRYKDCLFLGYYKERYLHAVKRENRIARFFSKYRWVETERVPHTFMISNKLFPEITEEDGIVGMDIERF